MQNPFAFEAEYREHVRQMAWINDTDWWFEPPPRRRTVRMMAAQLLLAVLAILAPSNDRLDPAAHEPPTGQ